MSNRAKPIGLVFNWKPDESSLRKQREEGPIPLVGICTEDVDNTGGAAGDKSVQIQTRGALVDANPRNVEGNAIAALSIANAFGMDLPRDFIFSAAQVFYDGGKLTEVRVSGWLPDGTQWERTRFAWGEESNRGAMLQVDRAGFLVLAEEDERRRHLSVFLISNRGETALSQLWDLSETAASTQADRAPLNLAEAREASIRIPTSLAEAFAAIRGGQLASAAKLWKDTTGKVFPMADGLAHWGFEPRQGETLLLPFNIADGITTATSAEGSARVILSGGLLLTYLTTWALWAERRESDGLFTFTPESVAELRGFTRYENSGRGGARYGKAIDEFKRDIAKLCFVGVNRVGDVSSAVAEPLIQVYRRDGRARHMYRHSPMAVMAITRMNGFAQLPRAVLRLDARDAPMANGLASFWRSQIVASALRPDAPGHWRGEIRSLLEQVGVYSEKERSKLGWAAYIAREAERLARVMSDGEFGEAHVEGEGARAIVTLTPSTLLATVYRPLLDAQAKAAERSLKRADEVAVRKALAPAQKPRRSRKPST